MAVKVFLTGATGYVRGTALDHIVRAHPEHKYTLLVCDEKRAAPVKERYPGVGFVYGSLDDVALMERAAAAADIVVHTADSADHLAAAAAIAKGLKDGHTAERPGYWIHLSGTAILMWYDAEHGRHGEGPLPEQTYRDVDDIERIVNLPDAALHREIDKLVQAANSDAVRAAIVCPPTIYGPGAGAVNTRSVQVPNLVKATLDKGFVPVVGAGKTEWDNVHVRDLCELFLKLVEASQEAPRCRDPDIWGRRAYFFVENGSHSWGEVARWIAQEASRQGYLPEPLTKSVSVDEVRLMPEGNSTWALNSKGVAQRAASRDGWRPREAPLRDTIADLVAREAEAAGLTPRDKKD